MFTGFLIILEIIMIGLRVAAAYFTERVPFFGKLAVPLTWVCVILGIICLVFIGIKAYKEIKSIKIKFDVGNHRLDINGDEF